MFLLLYSIWLILNGRVTLEICLIGLPVCSAVFLFAVKFLEYSWQKEKRLYQSIPWLICYVALLVVEILKANATVIKVTLFSKRNIRPIRVRFQVPLKSHFARVLLANSITLTPGTITAELNEDEYVVHCLSEELAEGIENSNFVRLLKKWEDNWNIGKKVG